METRTNKNGKTVYREKVIINGRPHKSAWSTRKTDGKNWRIKTLAERQSGTTGMNSNFNPNIKFDVFADMWFEKRVKVGTLVRLL